MKEFRFSLGDSNTDGLGLCFSIRAENEDEAVKMAQESQADLLGGLELGDLNGTVLDVVVYGGPKLIITSDDIDDETEVEDDA